MNRTAIATVGAALVTLALAGCAGSTAEAEPTPTRAPMESALIDCGLIAQSQGVTLGDDDTTLTLQTGDNVDYGVTPETTKCVLEGLGAPDSTWQLISSTRALDGRQTDDWDGYAAAWTYHPDDGLQVIVTTES